MSKYLDIPIEIIDDCINKNHLIKSVFRDDDVYGSMGFAYNKKVGLKLETLEDSVSLKIVMVL